MKNFTKNTVCDNLELLKHTSSNLISNISSKFDEPKRDNSQNSNFSAQDLFSMFTADIIKTNITFSR